MCEDEKTSLLAVLALPFPKHVPPSLQGEMLDLCAKIVFPRDMLTKLSAADGTVIGETGPSLIKRLGFEFQFEWKLVEMIGSYTTGVADEVEFLSFVVLCCFVQWRIDSVEIAFDGKFKAMLQGLTFASDPMFRFSNVAAQLFRNMYSLYLLGDDNELLEFLCEQTEKELAVCAGDWEDFERLIVKLAEKEIGGQAVPGRTEEILMKHITRIAKSWSFSTSSAHTIMSKFSGCLSNMNTQAVLMMLSLAPNLKPVVVETQGSLLISLLFARVEENPFITVDNVTCTSMSLPAAVVTGNVEMEIVEQRTFRKEVSLERLAMVEPVNVDLECPFFDMALAISGVVKLSQSLLDHCIGVFLEHVSNNILSHMFVFNIILSNVVLNKEQFKRLWSCLVSTPVFDPNVSVFDNTEYSNIIGKLRRDFFDAFARSGFPCLSFLLESLVEKPLLLGETLQIISPMLHFIHVDEFDDKNLIQIVSQQLVVWQKRHIEADDSNESFIELTRLGLILLFKNAAEKFPSAWFQNMFFLPAFFSLFFEEPTQEIAVNCLSQFFSSNAPISGPFVQFIRCFIDVARMQLPNERYAKLLVCFFRPLNEGILHGADVFDSLQDISTSAESVLQELDDGSVCQELFLELLQFISFRPSMFQLDIVNLMCSKLKLPNCHAEVTKKLLQIATGKQQFTNLGFFEIVVPAVLPALISVCHVEEEYVAVLTKLLELVRSSISNKVQANKGGLDIAVIDYLARMRDSTQMTESMTLAVSLLELINEVVSSTTAVQRYISLLVPINGQYLPIYQPALLKSMSMVASTAKSKPRTWIPMVPSMHSIRVKDIPAKVLNQGFMLTMWIYMEDGKDANQLKLISLEDECKCAYHILIASHTVWVCAENRTMVATSKVDRRLDTGKWVVVSIHGHPAPQGWEQFARVGAGISNDSISSWTGFTGELVEIRTNIQAEKMFTDATGYLGGFALSAYDEDSHFHIEWESLYSKVPKDALLSVVPIDKDYVLGIECKSIFPVTGVLESTVERKTSFVDILLNSVKVESLLPVIAGASLPLIDGCETENICELAIDVIANYLKLTTNITQMLGTCIPTLACLLKRIAENSITYGLYLRCVDFSTILDGVHQKEFCHRVLLNIDIWKRGGILTLHRVLRHWQRVLFSLFPDLFEFQLLVSKLSETEEMVTVQSLCEIIYQLEAPAPKTEHLEILVGFCLVLTNTDMLVVFLSLISRLYSLETAPDLDYCCLSQLYNLIAFNNEDVVLGVVKIVSKCRTDPTAEFRVMFSEIPLAMQTTSLLDMLLSTHLQSLLEVECLLAVMVHEEERLLKQMPDIALTNELAIMLVSMLLNQSVEHLVFDKLIRGGDEPVKFAMMIELFCNSMKIPSLALDFLYRYLLVSEIKNEAQFRELYPRIMDFIVFHSPYDHASVMGQLFPWYEEGDAPNSLNKTIKGIISDVAYVSCTNYHFGLRIEGDGSWKDLNLAKLCLLQFASYPLPEFLLSDLLLCRFVLRFDREFAIDHLFKIIAMQEKWGEMIQIVSQAALTLNIQLPSEIITISDPSATLGLLSTYSNPESFMTRLCEFQSEIECCLDAWKKHLLEECHAAQKHLGQIAIEIKDTINTESQRWDAEALQKWRSIYRELCLGIWKQDNDTKVMLHFKCDNVLCGTGSAMMPAKLMINHKHDDHLLAVLTRKTGSVQMAQRIMEEMKDNQASVKEEDKPNATLDSSKQISPRLETTNCVLVKCSGETPCFFELMKTQIFIYLPNRVHQIQLKHVYCAIPKPYLHQKHAIEIVTVDHRSFLLVFRTPDILQKLMRYSWFKKEETPLTQEWVEGEISNFEYLMNVNFCSGRTYNCPSQYPIMPWILSDYTSEQLNLEDISIYRDLSLPIGAINPQKNRECSLSYENCGYFFSSGPIGPAIVYRYLIRLEPFTSLHIAFQGGRFDHAERQFQTINRAYLHSVTTEPMELIPELFTCPDILVNKNKFELGTNVPNDDVELPPWASSPIDFIYKHRKALESDHVSQHLHDWINLMFGAYQRDPDHMNVYAPFLYEGFQPSEDMTQKEIDIALRNCGQIPSRLFTKPHPTRKVFERSSTISGLLSHQFDFSIDNILPLQKSRTSVLLCSAEGLVHSVIFTFTADKITPTTKKASNKKCTLDSLRLLTKHLLLGLDETHHKLTVVDWRDQKPLHSNIIFGTITFVECDAPIILAVADDATATFWRQDFLETPLFVVESTHGAYTCGCVRDSFDLAVLGAADGTLELVSLRHRKVTLTIKLDGHTPQIVAVSKSMGFILVYSTSAQELGALLTLFTVNGDHIKSVNLGSDEKVTNIELFVDHKGFDYAAIATASGKVFAFELYYMKPSVLMRNCQNPGTLHYDRKSHILMHFAASGKLTCFPFVPK